LWLSATKFIETGEFHVPAEPSRLLPAGVPYSKDAKSLRLRVAQLAPLPLFQESIFHRFLMLHQLQLKHFGYRHERKAVPDLVILHVSLAQDDCTCAVTHFVLPGTYLLNHQKLALTASSQNISTFTCTCDVEVSARAS
jgi:hypothetical protein